MYKGCPVTNDNRAESNSIEKFSRHCRIKFVYIRLYIFEKNEFENFSSTHALD